MFKHPPPARRGLILGILYASDPYPVCFAYASHMLYVPGALCVSYTTAADLCVAAVAVRTSPPIVDDCKVARQLCRGSTACQYITSIIPRLCGLELGESRPSLAARPRHYSTSVHTRKG